MLFPLAPLQCEHMRLPAELLRRGRQPFSALINGSSTGFQIPKKVKKHVKWLKTKCNYHLYMKYVYRKQFYEVFPKPM